MKHDISMQLKKEFIQQIHTVISSSREKAIRSVDSVRVLMYWEIGKLIFEEEQEGKDRTEYGTFLIRSLSESLEPQFGSSFSVRQLERYRQFYRTFPNTSALRTQFSWTHYKTLLSVNEDSKNIIASKYELYLPSEQTLLHELKTEIEKLKLSEHDLEN